MTNSFSTRILVVDDHPIYRNGIVNIISNIKSVVLIDEAENGIIAIDKLKKQAYDIVILDIDMPEMDGVEASEIIRHKFPNTKIIILTSSNSKRQMVDFLKKGVTGYILKNTTKAELSKAIDLIIDGNLYLTPEVYNIYADYLINQTKYIDNVKNRIILTKREKEILLETCMQLTTQQIADKLFLSYATVNNHRSNIMKKVGTDKVIGLVLYAVQSGLFVP